MRTNQIMAIALTDSQRDTLVELASHGPGSSLDPMILSQLFVLGLIEVRNEDRRVVLTERGRENFDAIAGTDGDPSDTIPSLPR